jgi:hypothetical protein
MDNVRNLNFRIHLQYLIARYTTAESRNEIVLFSGSVKFTSERRHPSTFLHILIRIAFCVVQASINSIYVMLARIQTKFWIRTRHCVRYLWKKFVLRCILSFGSRHQSGSEPIIPYWYLLKECVLWEIWLESKQSPGSEPTSDPAYNRILSHSSHRCVLWVTWLGSRPKSGSEPTSDPAWNRIRGTHSLVNICFFGKVGLNPDPKQRYYV